MPPRTKRAPAQATKPAGTPGAEPQQERAEEHPNGRHGHDLTITIPVDRTASAAAKAVKLPITAAQRVLPAKGGLPLYAGLGALGLAGVLEWPVAAGIGIGYAVLRRGGALPSSPTTPSTKPGTTTE
ncbi:hypothetical protein [Streptomyces macrosporus]